MKKLGFALLGLAMLVSAGSIAQAAMHEEEDTDNKFSIHGEVRFRGEYWNNLTDFTDTDASVSNGVGGSVSASDLNDSFDLYPWRIRLAAKGDLGGDVWVYGEIQSVGVAGGGLSEAVAPFGITDTFFGDRFEILNSGVEMYQGWVKLKDIGDSVLDLKFGRQEVVFDNSLHFSSLDYYNGIRHDGVMAGWDWDKFGIHGFWLRNSEFNQDSVVLLCDTLFNPGTGICPSEDADMNTLGAHFIHTLGEADDHHTIAYYAFLELQNASENVFGTGSVEDRGSVYTVGGRWARYRMGESGLSWNLEGSYQFGDTMCVFSSTWGDCGASNSDLTLDQKAWVLEGAIGWNWNIGSTDQKIWGGAFMATGDDDPTDDERANFDPLYPDFHNRLGYADLFAPSNINAYSVGYKASLSDGRHVLGATAYMFAKAEEEDFVMSPFGTFAVSDCTSGGGISCDDELGQELDLFYNYNITSNFGFNTALAWFEPGQAIEDAVSGFGTFSGAGEDAAWRLTLQARARW